MTWHNVLLPFVARHTELLGWLAVTVALSFYSAVGLWLVTSGHRYWMITRMTYIDWRKKRRTL